MSSSRTAIPPTASAFCRCSTATSPVLARRRGRPPPTAATPVVPISLPPKTVGHRRRLSQEMRHRRRRHGQKPVGVPPPAQFPRRYRGGDLLVQARLRRRPLHLAGSGSFQGLHLVCRGCPQLGAVRPTQTSLAAQPATSPQPSANPADQNCSQRESPFGLCCCNTKVSAHALQSV